MNEQNVTRNPRGYRWLAVIMGILSIIFGIWIFRNPVESYVGLSFYFCILLIIIGLFQIVNAFSALRASSWGWSLAFGIIDLVIGIILLTDLQWAESVLPIVIGFTLMFVGIDFIGLSVQMKNMMLSNWGWLLAGGILTLIFSFLIVVHPIFGIYNIIVWTGLSFIIGGITSIIYAFTKG